jgi:hypothetical protein
MIGVLHLKVDSRSYTWGVCGSGVEHVDCGAWRMAHVAIVAHDKAHVPAHDT